MSKVRNSWRVAVSLFGVVVAIACVTLLVKAAITQPPIGSWNTAASLSQPSAGASSALLQTGQILVTGGDNGSGPVAMADLVSSTDGSISTAAPMLLARENHISVTLQNGQVLVAGGAITGGGITNEAEIYDPTSNTWSSVPGGMVEARAGATATLLQNGEVLVAGGLGNNAVVSATAEIFDPKYASDGNSAFTIVSGNLSSPRENAAAALLQDGRVIIVGGSNGTAPLATSDIYDPSTGAIAAGPAMATPRQNLTATTFLNGLVLVAGGSNGSQDLASLELFDPSANSGAGGFSAPLDASGKPVTLVTAREGQQAVLLPHNGSVLIFGGTSAGVALSSAELFTGSVTTSDTWSYADAATGAMTAVRSDFTAASFSNGTGTSVDDGLLLAIGGKDASGNALSTTELYGFSWVKTDQYEYSPGSTANITGGGFQPGETVQMTLVESPYVDNDGPLSAVADSSGNISVQLPIDSQDANVTFYMTATGQTSGREAQTRFADYFKCCVTGGGGGGTSCTPTANWSVPSPTITQGTTSVALSGTFSVTCDSTTYYPEENETVSAAIGSTASGTLTFTDTSGHFSGTLSGTGSLASGSYTINYNYAGGAGTSGSTLPSESTTSTLTISSNPTPAFSKLGSQTISYGTVQLVLGGTLSYTPSGGGATIYPAQGETVSVTIGSVSGSLTVTDATGDFSGTVSPGTLGASSTAYPITYSYSGDAGLNQASDSTTTLTVNQAATTLSNLASPTIAYGATSVTVSGTVSASAPDGASTTTIYPPQNTASNPEIVAVNISNSSGTSVASFNAVINDTTGGFVGSTDPSSLLPGAYTITYKYEGDANFAASQQGTGTLTVSKPVPVFSGITNQVTTYGTSSLTLSGTLSYTPSGGGTTIYPASGSGQYVGVTIGPGSSVGANLLIGSNGQFSGTVDVSSLAASATPYTITYHYGGDSALASATNSSTKLDVGPATAAISLSQSNPSSITYGTSTVTLSGTVSASCGTNCTVYPPSTDSVSVSINNGAPVSASIGSNGAFTATLTTSALDASATAYTVSYVFNNPVSDSDFTSTSASGSLTVKQAPSTVTVTCPTTVQIYTGSAITPCTATATGAGGLNVTNLTVTYTNNINPGTATATATFAGDTNHTGNTGSATFQIGYNFSGLLSPYAPPPATFNVKRTMPLMWQYTDASGNAVNSSAANPQVLISMDSACSVTSASSTTDTITVSSSGSSGYQYDSTTNTWQFNWEVKGNQAGCYAIYVKNGQTGQLNGPYLISVTSH